MQLVRRQLRPPQRDPHGTQAEHLANLRQFAAERLRIEEDLLNDKRKLLADDKLAAMCLLLKEQVAALEDDLSQLEARLTRELCVPVKAQHSEAAMTQALQRLQADQKHEADSLAADLRRIQSQAELKRWLKEQSRAFKATSA